MARRSRWWGWGTDAHAGTLPEAALPLLREELGADASVRGPVALEEVELAAPALDAGVLDRLRAVAGVADDRTTRIVHAAGKGYVDLVRLRAGTPADAPDAVVRPGDTAGVLAVLELCAAERIAVVPFGGGTSVVGGLTPVRDGFAGVISLDLGGLTGIARLDERSLTATVRAGTQGPELEALLGADGYTLGHFPQSYEYISIGGAVATRSAGQASTGMGRIDKLVTGLDCVTPAGAMSLAPSPGTAAGPDLRDLLIGSEGALGVITEATLRIRRAPRATRYEGWMVPSFAAGAEAFRELEQAGEAPDVARLSDADETRFSMVVSGATAGTKGDVLRRYLGARGISGGCLMIVGWLDEPAAIARRRAAAAAAIRRIGGAGLGASAGRSWEKNRYHGPYLRDHLLDRGVMAETLETATTWDNLFVLYDAVRGALRDSLTGRGTPPIVWCHISHLYPSGCSLYFTFIARQERGSELEQWATAKAAACQAIVGHGGTITHHHAVGLDHAPYLPAEVGPLGIAALRAVKSELDPAGIMNPGKLLA
ncbi:MAG: FAD-binding oxidoreductase [Solirubrobacteraceae bacterium]